MLSTIEKLLDSSSFSSENMSLISQLIAIVVVIATAFICYFIAKYLLVRLIHKLIKKSSSELDDIFVKRNIFNRVSLLVPALVVYIFSPLALEAYDLISKLITTACLIYIVIIIALIVDSLIDSVVEIYYSASRNRVLPVQSIAQVAKIATYFLATILVISFVLGKSPMTLFAGLGAMAAVLMFVFKDPILGFVAGIQLSSNKMVRVGDWVEIPQHQADGDILEIGLTTVKVQNFDNTVTTVPTQSLINDSFKNWRAMQESGGRRIKRNIYIDVNSIEFCNQARLERFARIQYIKDYLLEKQQDIEEYNSKKQQEHQLDLSLLANGRRLTNIGSFRAYIQSYLENHPDINQNLTLLVRQLEPTDTGLPIQIYTFSTEKNWIKYEAIQSDIFDHLLAVAKEFDLRVFQQPTGHDFKGIFSDDQK